MIAITTSNSTSVNARDRDGGTTAMTVRCATVASRCRASAHG